MADAEQPKSRPDRLRAAIAGIDEQIAEHAAALERLREAREKLVADLRAAEAKRGGGDETFGQRLRRLIEQRKITSSEVASRVGVGRSVIFNYLADKRTPTLETAFRLAEALGVEVTEFKGVAFVRESRRSDESESGG